MNGTVKGISFGLYKNKNRVPKEYSQVRVVYEGLITHYLFYLQQPSEEYLFLSRVEIESYPDGNDKRIEFFDDIPSSLQTLIDNNGPWE